MKLKFFFFSLIVFFLFFQNSLWARSLNGFELKEPLVPKNEILKGGPPRDGIPPIDKPKFILATQVQFLDKEDLVIGILHEGEAKAYPIKILNWHEVVNDTLAGDAIVISYCPLCGTGMVFHRGKNTFGVSGLLYQSDLLLYDRNTESLWSQILMKAVNGPKKGETLKIFPSSMMTWKRWLKMVPHTLVLSTQTGHNRPYDRSPYGDYDQNNMIYYPIQNKNSRFHAKTITFALIKDKKIKLYPVSSLEKKGNKIIDHFAGEKVTLTFSPKDSYLELKTQSGKPMEFIRGFWFALATFYPDAEIYN